MDDIDALGRLGLSLAIGFLIGVERGWRERSEPEGGRAAGLRTFTLIGLLGGLSGLLTEELGPAPIGLVFIVLAGAATLFRWRETEREGTFGMTTLVAAFITFWLGAYAVVGSMVVAAGAAVATAGLLASKEWLHAWLRVLTWPELRAALILLAMTFVVLPVLPDEGYGPYEALNPRSIWLMTIVLAGVSFIGYVAMKVVGERYGPLVAGVAGGLVSSTATTLDFARQARTAPATWRIQLSGALAASSTMFVRVAVIVVVFGAAVTPGLIGPLGAAAVILALAALILNPPWTVRGADGQGGGTNLRNPLELGSAVSFATILVVVLVASKALIARFGAQGGIAFAVLAGIADVDAITLSMTRIAGTAQATIADAQTAILVAVGANSLAKSVLAFSIGGLRFGVVFLAATAVALAACVVFYLLTAL